MSTFDPKEYRKQYYQKNRERMLAAQKERDAKKDPEAKRAYRREYYRQNRERLLEQQRERGKRNYAAKPEAYSRRSRKSRLKTQYNLTEDEYQKMLSEQDFRCAICGSRSGRRKSSHPLLVDHDHETGEVRGLLCQPCNSALGMFEDDTDRMLKAIDYLRRSSSGATSMTSSERSSEDLRNSA